MTFLQFFSVAKSQQFRCNCISIYRSVTTMTRISEAAPKQFHNISRILSRTPKGPTPTRIEIHRQMSKFNESRLILDHEYSVMKDTLLFRYENPRFFKMMNIFAMSQFLFWSYLSHFAFMTMRDIPVNPEVKENENLPWWTKINFGKYRTGIALASFLIGKYCPDSRVTALLARNTRHLAVPGDWSEL